MEGSDLRICAGHERTDTGDDAQKATVQRVTKICYNTVFMRWPTFCELSRMSTRWRCFTTLSHLVQAVNKHTPVHSLISFLFLQQQQWRVNIYLAFYSTSHLWIHFCFTPLDAFYSFTTTRFSIKNTCS